MCFWHLQQHNWKYLPTTTGRTKKVTPEEKYYISEIVVDIFATFAEFTDEDSVHISCKFY